MRLACRSQSPGIISAEHVLALYQLNAPFGSSKLSDPPRQIAETYRVFHSAAADKMLTIALKQRQNGTLVGSARHGSAFAVRYRDSECCNRFGHKVDCVQDFPLVPLRHPQQWFDQIGYLNSLIFFRHFRQYLPLSSARYHVRSEHLRHTRKCSSQGSPAPAAPETGRRCRKLPPATPSAVHCRKS
jgi:hypothetical protein